VGCRTHLWEIKTVTEWVNESGAGECKWPGAWLPARLTFVILLAEESSFLCWSLLSWPVLPLAANLALASGEADGQETAAKQNQAGRFRHARGCFCRGVSHTDGSVVGDRFSKISHRD
jgi:hypothetical protein